MARETIASLAKRQLVMASEWSSMKNKFDSMVRKVDRTEKMVDRILFLLQNDESTGTKGLVEQVRNNTAFKNDFKAKSTLLGIIGGIISGVGFWVLNLIFKQ